MRGRLSIGIGVLCVMLGAGEGARAQSASDKNKLDATLKTLAESKSREAEITRQISQLQKEFSAMQKRAAAIAEKLQQAERRVSQQETALAGANTRLGMKQRAFEARRAEYAATLSSLLSMQRLPMTAILASPDKATEMVQAAMALKHVNRAAAQSVAALRKDLRQLGDLRAEADHRRTLTEKETEALKQEKAALEKAIRERQSLQVQLQADHAALQARVAELSRASQSLQALIGKLEKDQKTSGTLGVAESENFQAQKGKLRLPVAGEVTRRFGEAKPGGDSHRGLTLKTRAGATVTAPAAGVVVFTGPFRDYGNMLLIKHDRQYITLIAGLGNVSARLGQTLIRGEPVGSMPDRKDPEVYLELRDSTAKPIDPAEWYAKVMASK